MKPMTKSVIHTSVLALALGLASHVNAADPDMTFEAGVACDFALNIYIAPSDVQRVWKEWTDENGYPVRALSAGKGSAMTFENAETGSTISTKANGAVAHITYNADDTTTQVLTGHWVIIMWPTDIPAGPSTTLYVGRVVMTMDAAFNTTILETSGKATDICAALSN